MITLYLVRHGQSEASHRRRQKQNTRLGQAGRYQSAIIANRLPNLDAIYASPLTRAQETAKIISEKKALPFDTLQNLREIDRPSRFYGAPFDAPEHNLYMLELKKAIQQANMDWRYNGEGESFADLFFRCLNLEAWLKKRDHYENQKILFVGHRNILSMLTSVLILGKNATPEEIFSFFGNSHLPHGGMAILIYNGRWEIISADKKRTKK